MVASGVSRLRFDAASRQQHDRIRHTYHPRPRRAGSAQAPCRLVAAQGDTCPRRVQGSPLEPLWLPLADGTLAQDDIDLTPQMLDLDRLVDGMLAGVVQPTGVVRGQRRALRRCSSVRLTGTPNGDLFEVVAPYRVPWVEAILGNPVRATIQGGSMRTSAFVHQWSDWEQRTVRRHEGWLDLLARSTRALGGTQRWSARRCANPSTRAERSGRGGVRAGTDVPVALRTSVRTAQLP